MLMRKDLLEEEDKNIVGKGVNCVREEEIGENEVERIGEWISFRIKDIFIIIIERINGLDVFRSIDLFLRSWENFYLIEKFCFFY